jgi:hypothetical protein
MGKRLTLEQIERELAQHLGGGGVGGGGTFSLGAFPLLNMGVSLASSSASGVYDNLIRHYGIGVAQSIYDSLPSALTRSTNLRTGIINAIEAAGSAQGGVFAALQQGGFYGGASSAKGRASSKGSGGISISLGGGGYAGTSDMTSSAELSAYSQVLNDLASWNLESLSGQAWQMISDPGFHMNAGEVLNAIRNTDAYKAAFPGMALIHQMGLNMTETQYLARKQDIQDQFAQNGINQKMLTGDELGTLIANGIYGSNLTNRIQKGYEAVKNADPYVKQMLQKWYGLQPGHLLAYMLSPKHGMNQIIKDTQAAMIGTEAHLTGFQGLDKNTAQELSKQMTNSNYSMDYFRTGFKQAAGEQPLERAQVGQRGEATVSQSQILANTFSGLNQPKGTSVAGNAAALQLAAQARTAGLSGGGGYAQGQRGGEGIGYATSEGTAPAH